MFADGPQSGKNMIITYYQQSLSPSPLFGSSNSTQPTSTLLVRGLCCRVRYSLLPSKYQPKTTVHNYLPHSVHPPWTLFTKHSPPQPCHNHPPLLLQRDTRRGRFYLIIYRDEFALKSHFSSSTKGQRKHKPDGG